MRDDRTVTGDASGPHDDPDGPRAATLVGRSIRHYRVERELGRGGMGIVYAGRDTLLERHVALKVLPDTVATDPVRLARFRREAKILAMMNHPNIATIYGLEEFEGGRHAIVMELLSGETLQARMRRGPLSLQEAVRICEQIGLALEEAHERGVIHRDLKPANAMLAPNGSVKVLDFGMAWPASGSGTAVMPAGFADAGAREAAGVERAPVGGTPGYMSPEQIRGEPDDHGTDIFAFGCVLFECVTGRPAFGGRLAQDRVANTLTRSPDWSAWPADAPDSLRDLAARCLDPSRSERLADMRIARNVLRDAGGVTFVPSPAPEVPGLPRAASSFVGRSHELRDARRLLRRASLLTLVGTGGCGKTRLAQELARSVVSSFPDGVLYVDFVPLRDGERVPLEVGRALGLRDKHGTGMTEALTDRLREKAFLLVLDNCEHVLQEIAALTATLLRACPRLRVLATSREALRVTGEQELVVPPLPVPREEEQDLERISASEAVQLFQKRARLVDPEFRVVEANGAAVAGVCRLVDGIPLAIELAAARLRVLDPDELLARMRADLRVLATGGDVSSTRHRTLDGTIRWSYDHLVERQRGTFRALAVFAGGWTLEAAEAVVGGSDDSFDTVDDLTQLVNKSLVVVDRHPDTPFRYRMLETIRQFAKAELRASGEDGLRRQRHAEHFVSWVLGAEARLLGPEQVEWLNRFEADRENLVAAARYCEGIPNGAETALRLLAGLDRYWVRGGHFRLAQTVLDQALAMPGAERETIHRAKALCTAAAVASLRGDPRSASLFLACATLCRKIGDKRLEARARNGLGVCAIGSGDLPAAEEHLEEGVSLSRETGDATVLAMLTANLGVVSFQRKDFERARALFGEGLEMHRRMQNVGGELTLLGGVSRSALFLGDVGGARSALARALPLIERMGDRRNAATCLLTAGLLAVRVGDHRAAARLLAAGEAVRAGFAAQELLAPADREMQDAAVAAIRDALDPPSFDAAWSEGRALGFQEALRALADLVGVEAPAP